MPVCSNVRPTSRGPRTTHTPESIVTRQVRNTNVTDRRINAKDSAAQTAARIAHAQARIAQAVARIQSGDDWRDYLRLQSRLHSYSGNNTLLIWLQHAEAYEQGMVATPWPTYVAGFQTWKALGRSVDKGQHGYQILAPNRHAARVAIDAADARRPLTRDELPAPGESVETHQGILGFRIEHVFAAEQTSGADLPAPPTPTLLTGEAPDGLWDNITAQIRALGYAVRMAPSANELDGANGLTTWGDKSVQIRADMDDAARVKTALHELGHVLLHNPETLQAAYPDRPVPTRGAREVEAESVAFIVADAHHLATGDYSFPYVASWAGPDGIRTVQATTSRVAKAARQIIEASTVAHSTGGRVPGVEQARAARRARTPATRVYAELEPAVGGRGIERVP